MASRQSNCDILQVPASASADEIRQAFLDLVRVWHPDRFASDLRLQRLAEEKLKEITEAYQALSGAEPAREAAGPLTPGSAGLGERSAHGLAFKLLWFKVLGFATLFLGLWFLAGLGLGLLVTPLEDRVFMRQEALRMARLFGPEPAIAADVSESFGSLRAPGHTPGASGRKSRADVRPANGADLVPPRDGGGLGELHVRNESNVDCILRVVTRDSPATPLRVVYLRGGQEAAIHGLRPDIYRLRVAFGRGLNPVSLGFVESEAEDFWVGPFEFFQVESSKSRRGVRYSVGLKPPASAYLF